MMRAGIQKKLGTKSGLFFYALPNRGLVGLQPRNGRMPVAIFPNCIILTSEIHRELAQSADVYWHPAQRSLNANLAGWIVNFCADADEYRTALQYLELKTRIGAPIFNRPQAVLATARDRVTALVEGIPGLTVPKCVRFSPRLPRDFQRVFEREEFSYPVLVRPSGSQTGYGLIKIDGPNDWEKIYSIDWAMRELYMTQFIDMPLRDGQRAKLRVAFVNRKPFFRHVFFSKDEIVRTVPRNSESMEREVDYLQKLQKAPHVQELLEALASRIRLNFWGIDLGVGVDGNFLFFEATAAMSLTQAYGTRLEHERLYPVLLKPIVDALGAAVRAPSSWNCWD